MVIKPVIEISPLVFLILEFVYSSYCLCPSSSTQIDYSFLKFFGLYRETKKWSGCRVCQWWVVGGFWKQWMGIWPNLRFNYFCIHYFHSRFFFMLNLWSGRSCKNMHRMSERPWHLCCCTLTFNFNYLSVLQRRGCLLVHGTNSYRLFNEVFCLITIQFTIFLMCLS